MVDPLNERLDPVRARLRMLEHRAAVLEYPAVEEAERQRLTVELAEAEDRAGRFPPLDSPSLRIRCGVGSAHERHPHRTPWRRPRVARNVADLRAFHAEQGREDTVYVASAWAPGIDVALHYERGVFVQALSREEGALGEDWTDNLRAVASTPLRLHPAGSRTESRATKPYPEGLGPSTLAPTPPYPDHLEVRARVVMRSADLEALDRDRVDSARPPYVAPEGAVYASLRTLDTRVTRARSLKLVAAEAVDAPGLQSWWQMLGALKSWGFSIAPLTWRCQGFQEVLDFLAAVQRVAPTFDYPLSEALLVRNRTPPPLSAADLPPSSVRLVFPPVGRMAIVRRVHHVVGRSGMWLPIVELEAPPHASLPVPERAPVPAFASGRLALEEGDRVWVRRGRVAPTVAVERPEVGPAEGEPACLECGQAPRPLGPDEPFLGCDPASCRGAARAALQHLVGPRGLAMASLSGLPAERLIAELGAVDLPRVMSLSPEHVERLGPGRGLLFSEERGRIRALPLWRALYLAGIPGLSERSSRMIAQRVFSVETLLEEGLEAIGPFAWLGIEPTAWDAVSSWSRSRGPDFVARLAQAGVEVLNARASFPAPFYGVTAVVGGGFSPRCPRVIDELERRGASIQQTVGRSTNLVVLGEGAEAIRDAAVMYGIPVLDEERFCRLRAEVDRVTSLRL